MELKSKSWYGWYYKQFYNTYHLPKSLCKFFWGMILAILLFPITYPILIFRKMSKDTSDYPTMLGGLFWFMGLVGTIPLIKLFSIKSLTLLFLINPLGLILAIIFLGLFFGIIYCTVILVQYLLKRFKYRSKFIYANNNWFTEGIKSFFGKYCPKIDWK